MIQVYCTHGTGEGFHFIANIDPDEPTKPRRDERRDPEPGGYTKGDRPARHDPFYADSARSLYCTKCGRDPKLGPRKLETLVAGLAAAGVDEVDVSELPF